MSDRGSTLFRRPSGLALRFSPCAWRSAPRRFRSGDACARLSLAGRSLIRTIIRRYLSSDMRKFTCASILTHTCPLVKYNARSCAKFFAVGANMGWMSCEFRFFVLIAGSELFFVGNVRAFELRIICAHFVRKQEYQFARTRRKFFRKYFVPEISVENMQSSFCHAFV